VVVEVVVEEDMMGKMEKMGVIEVEVVTEVVTEGIVEDGKTEVSAEEVTTIQTKTEANEVEHGDGKTVPNVVVVDGKTEANEEVIVAEVIVGEVEEDMEDLILTLRHLVKWEMTSLTAVVSKINQEEVVVEEDSKGKVTQLQAVIQPGTKMQKRSTRMV
jgi:phage/plasmid primase-like uncharacterized protein